MFRMLLRGEEEEAWCHMPIATCPMPHMSSASSHVDWKFDSKSQEWVVWAWKCIISPWSGLSERGPTFSPIPPELRKRITSSNTPTRPINAGDLGTQSCAWPAKGKSSKEPAVIDTRNRLPMIGGGFRVNLLADCWFRFVVETTERGFPSVLPSPWPVPAHLTGMLVTPQWANSGYMSTETGS
jgi:hypothetical protein